MSGIDPIRAIEPGRVAAADPSRLLLYDTSVEKARVFIRVLTLAVQVVEAASLLRTAIGLIGLSARLAARKAMLEKLKESLEELNERLKALLERLEKKGDEAEDDADIQALLRQAEDEAQAVLLDESVEEIRRLVAGFDRRVSETRADVRERVEDNG